MKNPRAIAGVTVVALIVTVAAAMFLDRGPAAAEDRPDPAPARATASAAPSSVAQEPQLEQTPTAEPRGTPAPELGTIEVEDGDDRVIPGLDATLTGPERAAAWDAAIAVASAMTAQDPEEADRAARLAPMFAPGSPAVGIEGPAPFGAFVQPQTLGWVSPFEVEDDQTLGVLVSIHYEVVRQGSDGYGEFGEGDAEWFVYMVRDVAGTWLAADATLSASTDL